MIVVVIILVKPKVFLIKKSQKINNQLIHYETKITLY